MTIKEDKPSDASELAGAEDSEAEVDEFATDEEETVSAELDEFDADADDDGEDVEALEKVVEMSAKEQDARSLEIRRAIEERAEKRRQKQDIDYLDLDFDD